MRDKLIHEYFSVNLRRVWKTVKEDIPDLKHLFEKILKDFEQ
ncbi:MAG: HepT-like ribonuclease domain-containing protein [Candidatus Bathyarchaeia archaeon]